MNEWIFIYKSQGENFQTKLLSNSKNEKKKAEIWKNSIMWYIKGRYCERVDRVFRSLATSKFAKNQVLGWFTSPFFVKCN